jgi:DNA-binding response OmpR family regulator
MSSSTGAQILVVDDDPHIRSLLRLIAARIGLTVDTAADGVEAMELIRQNRYAVMLLDLMMPRMSGYQVLEALQGVSARPAVVLVSAMASARVTAATLDSGIVHSIVHKPFDIDMIGQLLTDTVRAMQAAGAESEPVVPPPLLVPKRLDGI